VLVMSATLGGGLGERAAALLRRAAAETPLLVSEGRAFPVHTVYLAAPGAGVQPYTLSDPYAWECRRAPAGSARGPSVGLEGGQARRQAAARAPVRTNAVRVRLNC